jgi:PAS domain S-box-containing protein
MARVASSGGTAEGTLEARFVIGPYGIIEGADDAATELLGYATDEILGQHGSLLVPRNAQPATAVTIDRMRRGELDRRAGRLVRRDGTVVTVEVRSRPLPDGRLALVVRRHAAVPSP